MTFFFLQCVCIRFLRFFPRLTTGTIKERQVLQDIPPQIFARAPFLSYYFFSFRFLRFTFRFPRAFLTFSLPFLNVLRLSPALRKPIPDGSPLFSSPGGGGPHPVAMFATCASSGSEANSANLSANSVEVYLIDLEGFSFALFPSWVSAPQQSSFSEPDRKTLQDKPWH